MRYCFGHEERGKRFDACFGLKLDLNVILLVI